MTGICFPFTTHQSPAFLKRKPFLTHKHPDSGGKASVSASGAQDTSAKPTMCLVAEGPGDGFFLVQ